MKLCGVMFGLALVSSVGMAQTLNCNLQDYKSVDGVKAVASGNAIELSWQGEQNQQLRARFTLRNGQPLIEELAARNAAEGDTYMKVSGDETYPLLAINYLKLDKVPAYNESWAPVVEGIHEGNFFGTSGEILFHKWGIEGSGAESVYTASIEYTFPLEFAELVWSDGSKVDRQVISLTDTLPFGTKTFRIPFDATGKKWIRFDVWDSAGDGAWLQPVVVK